MVDKKAQGKKNRQAGARFELKVRKDLESKGWIVDKWSNNVEFIEKPETDFLGANVAIAIRNNETYPKGKLIIAKRKYNPHKKVMAIGVGFPDFIAFKFIKKEKEVLSAKGIFYPTIKETESVSRIKLLYEVIGLEAKSNGYLDKVEREKCKWLLDNNIFSKILIASKSKERGEIVYKEFK